MFFEGCSWFKFNNLGLALGMALKFYTKVARGQPRPQSNLKKIALPLHDFAGNFYLISFVNCKTIEINLCNVVNYYNG